MAESQDRAATTAPSAKDSESALSSFLPASELNSRNEPAARNDGGPLTLCDSPEIKETIGREMYRIPGYAGWFSWNKIHAIERRSMVEFFDSSSISKTPKVYKEYRDFIINKYREKPRKLLTFTEVRRMLVGDVNVIKRVFDFTEYWGLINYHVMPENKQQANNVEREPSLPSDIIPPGLQIVYPRIIKPQSSMESSANSSLDISPSSLVSYRNTFMDSVLEPLSATSNRSVDESPVFICSNCGANCQEKNYKSVKKEEFVLCEICFLKVDNILKEDFSRKEGSPESQLCHNGWTKEEMLKFLEALSKYRENWDVVAHHMETKSKAECIIQFMKLPFGDRFLQRNVQDTMLHFMSTTGIKRDLSLKDVHTEQKERNHGVEVMELVQDGNEHLDSVPSSGKKFMTTLADTNNPILAQASFLSAMVGPRVGAAASHAALMALADEDPVALQFLSSMHGSNGLQVASRENMKKEELKDDTLSCREDGTHRAKDVETEYGHDILPSVTQVRAGIATAIGAVAANAKLLADQEEREIEHLMATIIDNQLKKLACKLEHFEELEHMLKEEHLQLERIQGQVLADWIRFSHYNYNAGRS